MDNKDYIEGTPEHISEYVQNYEVWIREILASILKSMIVFTSWNLVGNEKKPFLLVNDLYDSITGQYFKDKVQDKDKKIKHYCILFILDILRVFLTEEAPSLSEQARV